MSRRDPTVSITVRFPKALARRMGERAKQDHQSVSTLLRRYAELGLNGEDYMNAPDDIGKSTTHSRSIFTLISLVRHDKAAPGCRNILGPLWEAQNILIRAEPWSTPFFCALRLRGFPALLPRLGPAVPPGPQEQEDGEDCSTQDDPQSQEEILAHEHPGHHAAVQQGNNAAEVPVPAALPAGPRLNQHGGQGDGVDGPDVHGVSAPLLQIQMVFQDIAGAQEHEHRGDQHQANPRPAG